MENKQKASVGFYGGVGSTTGSNFLLEALGQKIIVDCGMFQGQKFCDDVNRKPFAYKPSDINSVLVTHGHLDHVGRIPKLVAGGFAGTIYSTPETRQIAELIFEDGVSIMQHEAREGGSSPLYTMSDVESALSLWKDVPYHEDIDLGKGITGLFLDAGHILGSSIIEITLEGKSFGDAQDKKVVFSGDLGNSPAPLLRNTEEVADAEYLVIESVYGDRVHESAKQRRLKLEDIIEDTVRKKGVLLIPAFSIERTQTLLSEINHLVERGKISPIPVFLDSPFAIKVTELYKKSDLYFNEHTKNIIASGDDIFNFPKLKFTKTSQESSDIANTPNPKIIIAGSGMSNGGRILHHERNYLSDPTTTLLIVGFQAAGSLGRRILDGAREVEIDGQTVKISAKVRTLFAYSAHKDRDGLLDFVDHTSHTLKNVFVAMGEPHASMYLAQRLRDYLGVNAVVPEIGETFSLDL